MANKKEIFETRKEIRKLLDIELRRLNEENELISKKLDDKLEGFKKRASELQKFSNLKTKFQSGGLVLVLGAGVDLLFLRQSII